MAKKGEIIEGEYSLPEFETLKDIPWVFTEKVDGTNIRVMWDGNNVQFGGKTDNAQIPVPLLYALQKLFEGTAKKQLFIDQFGADPTEVCLYGEGYGPKIQKVGALYREDPSFVLFDVKIGHWYLLRENVEEIAEKLQIDVVPIVGEGTLEYACSMVEKGFDSCWGDFQAEGIVARPKTELCTRNGKRIITKIKCRDFK